MDYSVIIAGGCGTRLWPLSTPDRPKQFLPIIHGQTLLQIACRRLAGVVACDHQWICTAERFRASIHEQMPTMDDERIVGEPQGRDTLAAITLPVALIARRDPQAAIGIFTADHLIEPVEPFRDCVRSAFELVRRQPDTIVTFGLQPSYPATAYGYLRVGEPLEGSSQAHRVAQFKEKPSAAVAQTYLAGGQYLWNSGMFIFKASALLGCLQRNEPQFHDQLMRIVAAWDTPQRRTLLESVYPTLKKISFDYAVMEPAAADPAVRVAVIRMPVNWLDIGSWAAYAQTVAPDAQGNRCVATHHALLDSRNNLIVSQDPDHLIAMIGIEDCVIVHAPHATFIARRDQADRIKELRQESPKSS